MTSGIRKILLFLTLVLLICLTACSKDNVSDFTADWTYFAVGEDSTITFTVKANRSPILFMENNEIGQMYDDGTNGDVVENDGIFTLAIETSATEEKTETYHAAVRKTRTEDITVYYYDDPNADEIYSFETETAEIESLATLFLDENGFVSDNEKEEALDNVLQYANELKENGQVAECWKNEDNVCIRFSSGLTYVYIPNLEGNLDAGNDIQMQIITCEPFRSQFPNVNIDDASRNVIQELSNITIYSMMDNDAVTTKAVKNEFKSNRIIMWCGHGSYDPIAFHTMILTGEPAELMLLNMSDVVSGRIFVSGGRVAFTSAFIDKYCGHMDNSVIYLNCCFSGKDEAMANAFLNKGAAAYIGNTGTIAASYATKIQEEVLTQMINPSKDSSGYNTLSDSVRLAKEKYGQFDPIYKTETVIFGDGSVRFSNKEPDSNEIRAYKAYIEVLYDYENAILGYDWQNGYYGYGEITEDNMPRPISIADVNGDQIPELIFVAQDPEYESLTQLHIFEYKDGHLSELYNRKWDYMVGGGFSYLLFKVDSDDALYAYYAEGDAWHEDNYMRLTEENDGTYELKQLCKYSNHVGNTGDYNVRDIHYFDGENECDEVTYTARVEKLRNSISEILMNNVRLKEDAERYGCRALDYDQALEYLLDKTSPNAKEE